jgi:hypothetical protein
LALQGELSGLWRIQSRYGRRQLPSCARLGQPWAAVPTLAGGRRLGFRCHDAQRRRLRVRLNLPSGLLMARRKLGRVGEQLQPRDSRSADESPRGDDWAGPDPGGSHRQFPSTPEGWFPVKGKTRSLAQSQLNYESRPGVYGRSPLEGDLQKVLWDA